MTWRPPIDPDEEPPGAWLVPILVVIVLLVLTLWLVAR